MQAAQLLTLQQALAAGGAALAKTSGRAGPGAGALLIDGALRGWLFSAAPAKPLAYAVSRLDYTRHRRL